MTNEQLAIHLEQIRHRLAAGLIELKAKLTEDLPEEKWQEVQPIWGPPHQEYEPLLPLQQLRADLAEEVRLLRSSH